MLQFPSHGANYEQLYKNFKMELPSKVYDLSENVNYLGAPKQIEKLWPTLLEKLASYPNPLAEPLRSKIAQKHNVSKDHVLVGNGGAELLTFFAQSYKDKKVILVHPTFSEYQSTLEVAGAEVVDIIVENIESYEIPVKQIKEAMIHSNCLYLCNPNNPTGAIIPIHTILDLVRFGVEHDCSILIDEAFMDWTDEQHSAIPYVLEYQNVTIMRSMTKMYGIAGIRLGYMIGNPKLVNQIRKHLPHWNVNNLAISIGELCLKEEEFRQHSIRSAINQSQNLRTFLQAQHCKVTNSEANFLCFQLPNAQRTRDFYFYCLLQGVVLRHTENYQGMNGEWLRIGMKGEEALSKFKEVMIEWRSSLTNE